MLARSSKYNAGDIKMCRSTCTLAGQGVSTCFPQLRKFLGDSSPIVSCSVREPSFLHYFLEIPLSNFREMPITYRTTVIQYQITRLWEKKYQLTKVIWIFHFKHKTLQLSGPIGLNFI